MGNLFRRVINCQLLCRTGWQPLLWEYGATLEQVRRNFTVCTPCNRKHADSSMASSRAGRSLSVVGIIVMINGQEMSIDCLCPEKSERALVGCLHKTVLSGRKEARTSVWCAVEHSTHRTFVRGDFILCRNHNIKIETFRIFLRSLQKTARNP